MPAPRGGATDSHFLYGILAMPGPARAAARRIYEFCRQADDDADLNPAEGAEKLAGWRAEVEATFHGHPGARQTAALVPYILEYRLKKEYFVKMMEGFRMDLEKRRYADINELYKYCECVAEAPGLLILQVLRLHDNPVVRGYGHELAMGLQLVNILRDMGEDAGKGRIYVPEEDLSVAGYSESELKSHVVNKAFYDLARLEAGRARSHLKNAEEILHKERALKKVLLGPEIMRATYQELLGRMERRMDDCLFGEAPRLGHLDRLAVAASMWLEGLVA